MGTLHSARRIIGNLILGNGDQQPMQGQQLAQTAITTTPTAAPAVPPTPSSAQTITVPMPDTQPLSVGTMTPEQLRARRTHQIENASIGKSLHVRFFLWLVTCWLFIGPLWYVVLTTSEVGWALSRRSFTWGDQTSINFYAGALFIELGMMFSTFFLAYLRHLQAESEGKNRLVNRAVTGLVVIWLLLAGISALGQFYYLFNASNVERDGFHVAFVVSRVVAFTVVDFSTAFYLSRIQSTLDELMEANRKKGHYYVDMAQVDADLMRKETEAAIQVEQAQMDLHDKRQKNQLSNRIITIATDAVMREVENKFTPTNQLPLPNNRSNDQNNQQDIL